MPDSNGKSRTTIPPTVPTIQTADVYRTKSIATRLTDAEFVAVEAAASGAGKKLAEWLREAALKQIRGAPEEGGKTDPILLAEVIALRDLMLNLFAVASKGPLSDETLRKISAYADSIKRQKAQRILSPKNRQSPPEGPDETA